MLNTHYCALERKYCDDEKGCVESTFSCATGGSHSIMIVTAKDSGKSANYDCNQNQYIKDEKVLLNFDEIEYKLRCNPELGCAEFYCDGKNHILYTSFDEPENCKAEYGEYCSNKYNGCIECDLDNFKPYCLDSETLITACVLEDDFVEAVEKECNSCKGSTCK